MIQIFYICTKYVCIMWASLGIWLTWLLQRHSSDTLSARWRHWDGQIMAQSMVQELGTGVQSRQPKVLASEIGKEGVLSLERNMDYYSSWFMFVLFCRCCHCCCCYCCFVGNLSYLIYIDSHTRLLGSPLTDSVHFWIS